MPPSRIEEGFVYNGLLLTIFGVLNGVLNYAFQLLMGEVLSAEEFLNFNAMIALGLLSGSPFGAVQTVATQYVATLSATSDKGVVSQLFRRLAPRVWLAVFAGALLVAAGGLFVTEWLRFPDALSFWLLIAIVAVNLLLAANTTFLQGLRRFLWLGSLPVTNVLLRMVCCGLLAGSLGWGLHGGLIGFAAGGAICVAIGGAVLASGKRDVPHHAAKLPRFPFKLVPPVIAATFGLASMTQIDLVLVNRFFEPAVASQYALAAVLGKAVLYLPMGLFTAILPTVAASHARHIDGRRQARQAMLATLGLAGSAAVACAVLGPWFVNLLYGEKYGNAGRLLGFYGFAMVPMGVALVSQAYVVAKGRPAFSWIISVFAIAELAMLSVWHPSLEAVIGTIAAFHTGLAVAGATLVMITASVPDNRDRCDTN